MYSCAIDEPLEHALFEEAVDSLPAELTIFKELFGPSFIRAIKTVLSDCDALLKKLDASYEPTMDEIRKKYDDAVKVYEEEVTAHPEEAEKLEDAEIRALKNFMEGANGARKEERKKIKEQCELRKQDLFRNRMFAVLTVFKQIYQADPNNLLLVINQLESFILKLEEGLEECRKMVNSLNVDDPLLLCDDDAIAEAIGFIKAVLVTLPSQVEKGFPDLPGDTEGEAVPLDDGSTPDIFVGNIPNILMPGPVITDEPPEDDDDASGMSAVGIHDGSGDIPTNVATTDATVTTSSSVTSDSTVTTDSMVTTDSTVTSDATVTTDSTVTTDGVIASSSTGTTGIVDDVTVVTDGDDATTGATVVIDTDHATVANIDDDDDDDAITIEEVATTQPIAVEDGGTAKQTINRADSDDDDDNNDDDNGLLPLFIALLVCISLLVVVMVIMVVVVLILRHKAMQGRNESVMSEDDKLSLMKEGYANPTYQFFDKSSSAH